MFHLKTEIAYYTDFLLTLSFYITLKNECYYLEIYKLLLQEVANISEEE